MIALSTHADDAAGTIPASRITAAAYHPDSGILVITGTGKSGETITRTVSGQDGADLYNALLAIQQGSYTVVEPPEPEPAPKPRPGRPRPEPEPEPEPDPEPEPESRGKHLFGKHSKDEPHHRNKH